MRQEGLTRLTFRCSPYHTNSAIYPIIESMQRTLGWEPDDSAGTRLTKLEQALEVTSLELPEAVPLMASLLSLELPEGRYPELTLSSQQLRHQIQDTLVAWLQQEADRQPMLAVWEDLHWADPSTLEVLSLILEQTPTSPMLHLLTYRPEFEPPWSTRSHITPISLNRLERPQVEGLILHLTADKRLPAEVLEHIVNKTDGVPLYVEELTKMLLESELLQEEAGQYTLTGPLATVAIPDTLQDSLMARLDQMNTAKEVAQLGAVLGREFPYEMLRAIAVQDEPLLQSSLAQLVEAELLYQRGRPPRARYMFKHALIQDAAYASLLHSTRRQVHHQVAALLETHLAGSAEEQPELLAYHYGEAGQDETALDYWQRAGQCALQRSAHVEAIAHLRRGLDLLITLQETPESLQQELELQVALGTSLIATKGSAAPEVESAYVRAWELCQKVGATPQSFPALRGLMLYYMNRGDVQTALQLGQELLSLAEAQPDPSLLMLAHNMMGTAFYTGADLASAHTHHSKVLAIHSSQEYQGLSVSYDNTSLEHAHRFLAFELWPLGYPDQALQHSHAALKLTQEKPWSTYSLALAQCFVAILHQWRREPQAVLQLSQVLITLATEQGYTLRLAQGQALYGWALAIEGQGERGIAEICQGLTASQATGDKAYGPHILGLLAEAYGKSGAPEKGLNVLAEVETVLDSTESRWYEAELYRLKGVLLLRQDVPAPSQAETLFRQAIDIAIRQQAKSWELRAAISLAKLWKSQGKQQEAYELLAPVYGWFTEGFDTADLQEAKALLSELRV